MKKNQAYSFATLSVAGLIFVGLCAFSLARGQATEMWDGGPGTWDVNNTPNWNTGVWTNDNDASFGNGTGIVNVSDQGGAAPVTIDQVHIDDGSVGTGYTFSGSSLATESNDTDVLVDSGNTADITFDNEFIVNVTPNAFFGNDQANFTNNSQATVTYGDMQIQNANSISRTGVEIIGLNQVAGGKTVVDGDISAGDTGGTTPLLWFNLNVGNGGTYEVKGSIANGIGLQYNVNGTVLLGTSNLGDQNINVIGIDYTDPTKILTDGAQTVGIGIRTQNDTLLYIGGSTDDTSNFNGSISIFAQTVLVAADGGRVNFNTGVDGQLGTGLTTSGNGTIALNNSTGNSYGTQYRLTGFSSGTVAATLGATMTLINNGSGDAFGGSSNAGDVVNLLANSGLGGTGSTSEKVVAADHTSVIAPGDGAIGTLNLAGGLEADSGLTMDFKLDGSDSDLLTVAGLTLGGTTTIKLTAFGSDPLLTDTPYQLIDGSGTWTTNPDFTIVAPTGYTATYNYQYFNNSLTVELEATPEPSTYAMMLGGLALLGFCVRRKAALLS